MTHLKSLKPQSGVTLLSMLIGVVISLLTMAALFVLFQQSTVQGTQMRKDINLEGQLATILLSIQQDVQSAGYGIELDDSKAQIVKGTGSEFTLYWRYFVHPTDPTKFTCRGFEEYIDLADNTLKMRWLNEIECTENETLSGNLWTGANADKVQLAAVFENVSSSLLSGSSLPGKQMCWPYSSGEPSMHQVLKIEALNSIVDAAGTQDSYSFTYCLTNL